MLPKRARTQLALPDLFPHWGVSRLWAASRAFLSAGVRGARKLKLPLVEPLEATGSPRNGAASPREFTSRDFEGPRIVASPYPSMLLITSKSGAAGPLFHRIVES